jgi:hypothetical protein
MSMLFQPSFDFSIQSPPRQGIDSLHGVSADPIPVGINFCVFHSHKDRMIYPVIHNSVHIFPVHYSPNNILFGCFYFRLSTFRFSDTSSLGEF